MALTALFKRSHGRLRTVSTAGWIAAVLIDAKHERAKAFYARYEFDALPDQPLTLWLPIPALRKLFEPE